MLPDLPKRIEAKISPEPNSGCWLWTGATNNDGYGVTWLDGANAYAHRVVYKMLRGPIPIGLHIDHLCRVRCCVNPDHLEPVTCKENVLRGDSGPQETCLRGHVFDEANTLFRKDKVGRECRACRKLAKLRYKPETF